MPFAAVSPCSRPRRDRGLAVRVRGIREPDLVAVDRQIFPGAVNVGRNVILVSCNGFKSPFCDIRVLCHQEDPVVVQDVRLHNCLEACQTVFAAHFFALGHKSRRSRRVIVIRDSEGRAVQPVRVRLSIGIVFQLDPGVRIGRAVIGRKTVAVVSALHIPVIIAASLHAEGVRLARERAGRKDSRLIPVLREPQTVAALIDIQPVSIVIQAVDFILVLSLLFKIVFDRAVIDRAVG